MDQSKYWRQFNKWFWTIYLLPILVGIFTLITNKIIPPTFCMHSELPEPCFSSATQIFASVLLFTLFLSPIAGIITSAYYSKKLIKTFSYLYISICVFLLQIISFFYILLIYPQRYEYTTSYLNDPNSPTIQLKLAVLLTIISLTEAFLGYLYFKNRLKLTQSRENQE